PLAVMREWGVPVAVTVPEPNTWREVLEATAGRTETKIVVQEYGKPATELVEGLIARGSSITRVPVYQWALPENLEPLRNAVRGLAHGSFDVLLLTSSIQVHHLLQIAVQEGIEAELRNALSNVVVASVGPTTSETLAEHNLPMDFEPSHPKMGFLLNETA